MAPGSRRPFSGRVKPRHARQARTPISALHVLLLLFAFRIVNALAIQTFFVPDEYYQSLEPAWQLAFGPRSGAWITWEWRHQLRSSLHPVLFAAIYRTAALWSRFFTVTPASASAILLAAPKVMQALFAAGLDFYTWRLGQSIFGSASRAAWTILAVSALSPWQWFCSTRTLSNSLEASLTACALYHWPWNWMLPARNDELKGRKSQWTSGSQAIDPHMEKGPARPIISLLLAATASVLRPTNVLVWIPLALQTLSKLSNRQRISLITRAIACGVTIACLSACSDRLYYGFPTFPQLRFLTFNIHQDLAVFYGVHRPDYYFTEGLPLLLMGLLPFAMFGLIRGLSWSFHGRNLTSYSLEVITLPAFAWTIVFVILVMSLISHKEARFIYPLLPCLHIVAGNSVSMMTRKSSVWKGFILLGILLLHTIIAQYSTRTHQRGVIDVLHFLKARHDSRAHDAVTTVAFLMPCHSTPWRSHLMDPKIDAWALTCEPPVGMLPDQRAIYMDEADIFYDDVETWLRRNMEELSDSTVLNVQEQSIKAAKHHERTINGQITGRYRPWPHYVAFFEQLEPQMRAWFEHSSYVECTRFFNTHWHDDWRRKGDIVVYCLRDVALHDSRK